MGIRRIYDCLSVHRKFLWCSLAGFVAFFVLLVCGLGFNEDIRDFLPLDSSDREALSVYQEISGADDLYIIFSGSDDPDRTVRAVDSFEEMLGTLDTDHLCPNLKTRVEYSDIQEVADFVQDNIPYFLTADDYRRIGTLLADPACLANSLRRDRELLMIPGGGMVAGSIASDPLSLFSPVFTSLQATSPQESFELYDGYIFTPDMSRAVVMLDSPFGNSETRNNSRLISLLNAATQKVEADNPGIDVDIVGGPEIAVGNSDRIRKDTFLAVGLSLLLMVLLLWRSFNSVRNIALMFLSVAWGWLFALTGISLLRDSVSIIIIGISSVILGIAINYPLHLISHISHEKDIRVAMKQLFAPLVIGNITTVGAFLALVPLKSVALSDLGLFASLLLVGTLLFVLVYLPHFVKVGVQPQSDSLFLGKLSSISFDRNRYLPAVIALLTPVLAFFSLSTEFDSDVSHLNYMTLRQKEQMQYFASLEKGMTPDSVREVFVLGKGRTLEEALEKNLENSHIADSLSSVSHLTGHRAVARFLVPRSEQRKRLDMWNEFVASRRPLLKDSLSNEARRAGFTADAFAPFDALLDKDYAPRDVEYFAPLINSIFARNISVPDGDGPSYVVDVLDVDEDDVARVKASFEKCFDVKGLNSSLSTGLSDNFNYIGLACSLIVFIFLWFSFGRIELALISFLPMAVSWLWILGVMGILGLKFNIVNVILATFIFGQGDDYTIFITEGCQYEYTHRRKVLSSYKNSIMQSALIMFVGMGTLIVARHPALRSLAEVTIVGMFSVVFMAYVIPPLLFRFITEKKGVIREYPLTLRSVVCGIPDEPRKRVEGRYLYKGREVLRTVRRNLRESDAALKDYDGSAVFVDNGYGERAILLALSRPDIKINVFIGDEEHRRIAVIAAENFVDNIEFI